MSDPNQTQATTEVEDSSPRLAAAAAQAAPMTPGVHPAEQPLFAAYDGLQRALIQCVYMHRMLADVGHAVADHGNVDLLKQYAFALSTLAGVEDSIDEACGQLEHVDVDAFLERARKAA